MPWREFIEKQNPSLYEPQEPDPRHYPYNQQAYHDHINRNRDRNAHSVPPSSSTTSSPPSLYFPRSSSPSSGSGIPDTIPKPSEEAHRRDVEAALDLAEQLMNPYSTRRITPRQALAHPFLRGEEGYFDEAADDDEFVPHRPGEGVCGQWHFVDGVTDAQCVKVPVQCGCGCGEMYEEVQMLEAGQGMAIGRQPCEFHQGMAVYG